MTQNSTGSEAYRVGDIEVVTVPDGKRTFPLPDGFILNASRGEINKALAAAGMAPDEMTIHFNPVVIRTGSKIILIDAGNGAAAATGPAGSGLLMQNFAAAGISASDIDLVVISHFHGDHINGLIGTDGTAAFPQARVTVPELEWAYWTNADNRAKAPEGRMRDLFANVGRVFDRLKGRIDQYRWDEEVVPGLLALGTPGHTPGHTSFMLSSQGERLFIQSDVTNHPALFARNPGWHAAFDQDPVQAESTRRRIYDMLVDEHLPVQGFHYPLPSRAYVARDGEGYKLRSLNT